MKISSICLMVQFCLHLTVGNALLSTWRMPRLSNTGNESIAQRAALRVIIRRGIFQIGRHIRILTGWEPMFVLCSLLGRRHCIGDDLQRINIRDFIQEMGEFPFHLFATSGLFPETLRFQFQLCSVRFLGFVVLFFLLN